MDTKKVLEVTKNEVETLKKLMNIDAPVKCTVDESEKETVLVNVVFEGEELGYMIGNRGAHLQAFQYVLSNLVKTALRKETKEEIINVSIIVDAAGYRQQRAERIERLAMQKADDARILGDSIDLLPMSAGDRRIVHSALSKFDDIKTESFGEGFDRYVRITPLKEKELGVSLEVDGQDDTQE